jgi:hypothetical protein
LQDVKAEVNLARRECNHKKKTRHVPGLFS